MNWFTSHKKLTIIIVTLLVLTVFLLGSFAMRNNEGPIGGAARTVISYAQKPFIAFGDWASEALGNLFSDEDLMAENQALKEEVESLKSQLARHRLSEEELNSLTELSKSLRTPELQQNYQLVAANVLSFDGSDVFNIFTIDIGTESGVHRNSVVVNGDGLVGRVISSGQGWAKVVAAIDENNNIGFQIHKTQNFIGVCHGNGEGGMTGYLLDDEGAADEGDEVITSGIGGIYPAGLVIGKVTEAKLDDGGQLMSVEIEPTVYFKGLTKVVVLV
jgi:rod shape-determining protein MreC